MMNTNDKHWDNCITACLENGKRILEDSKYLEEYGRDTSSVTLAILAQEEFEKAYLLKLVSEGALPYCKEVERACRDHSCKHLIGIVMAYLFIPIENLPSWIDRNKEVISIPTEIADALNIFCHEKLRKWRSQNWFWADDPDYNKIAKAIGKGSHDKKKQDSVYVNFNQSSIANIPHFDKDEANAEIQLAEQLFEVVRCDDIFAFKEKRYICDALKLMTEIMKPSKDETGDRSLSYIIIGRSDDEDNISNLPNQQPPS